MFRRIGRARFLGITLVSALLWAFTLTAEAAAPPQPTYDTASVNGNLGEWESGDFFADLYRNANAASTVEAKLYLRYDCATQTLYVLVLDTSGFSNPRSVRAGNSDDASHFVKFGAGSVLVDGNSGDNGTPPDFQYVDESSNIADGWEASLKVAPGVYTDFNVHTRVNNNGTQEVGVANNGIALTLQCGTIIVVKDVDPGTHPQDFEFEIGPNVDDFTLDDDDNNNNSRSNTETLNVPAGIYTVEEEGEDGWALSNLVCDDSDSVEDIATRTATIHLASGETVTCTFTNVKAVKAIKIVKETEPDNTISTDFPFSTTGVGLTDFALDTAFGGEPSSITFENLVPGTYTVTEGAVTGWGLVEIDCDVDNDDDDDDEDEFTIAGATVTFSLEAGDEVECTFTNSDKGTIKIIKDVVPGTHPQDFTFTTTGGLSPSTFQLDDSPGDEPQSETFVDLTPGVYTVTESAVATWGLFDLVCVDPTQNTTIDNGLRKATIDVAAGETVTCTFVNSQKGKIIVQKETLPDGSAQTFEFDPSWSGANFTLGDGQSHDSGLLDPDTYTVSELPVAGWNLTNVTCSDGSPSNAISLQAGETITCTFTNRQTASITLIKEATPEDGTNFTFVTTIPAHNVVFLDDAAIDDNDGITNSATFTVFPGIYTVIESGQAGWNLTGLACESSDPNTGLTVVNNVAFFTAGGNETITCTFTNVKREGRITIVKDAVPDDGQDFSFSGSPTIGNFTLDDDSDGALPNSRTFTLVPGSYTISESNVSGWDLTDIVCVTDDTSEQPNVQVSSRLVTINLDGDEDVTCTFVNVKRGKITVVKDAQPDSGVDFTVSLGGDAAGNIILDDAVPQDGDIANTSETFLFAPGHYTLTELDTPGWELASVVCSTTDQNEAVSVVNSVADIQLDAGEEVTCTFTNVLEQGTITIVKDAVPDDGQDFSFSGSPTIGNFSLDDDADGALPNSRTFTVVPGSYVISEGSVSGWDLTDIVCVTDDTSEQPNVQVSSRLVTIQLDGDEDVTCTFVNVKRGKITVVKDAQPDSGVDFTVSLGGDAAGNIILDDAVPQDGDIANTSETFLFAPGHYTLTELDTPGWELASVVCSTTDQNEPVNVVNGVADINLDAGEEVTCTFTNVLEQGTITIVKDAVPDDGQDFSFSGSPTIGNFSLDDDAEGTLPNSRTFTVVPGSYIISESNVSGWDLTDIVCVTDDTSQSPTVNVDSELVTINLDGDEDVTCTFVNVKRGKITVVKDAQPDSGVDFTVSLGGDASGNIILDDAVPQDGDIANTFETIDLPPGHYTLTELDTPGWDLASVVCSTTDQNEPVSVVNGVADIQLDAGEEVTCTFTNVLEQGSLKVTKVVDWSGMPVNNAQTFHVCINGPSGNFCYDFDFDGGDHIFAGLTPGSYTVSETNPGPLWDVSVSGSPANVTAGGLAEVTITNTLDAVCTEATYNPEADLSGQLVSRTHGIVTNTSLVCTYIVGMASYKRYDDTLENQVLFDYDWPREVGPGETIHLYADYYTPCAVQVDLFYGDLIEDFGVEGIYGTRMLANRVSTNLPFCFDPPPDNDGDGSDANVDCNDNDPSIYPGASEIPNDEVDQDCNGSDLVVDSDGDAVPDDLDACPLSPNDAVGDPCNHDEDGDTVTDDVDACPLSPNDAVGDPCNHDEDGDTVADDVDACPLSPNDSFNDPCNHDEDSDGLLDDNELNVHVTDPANADSDGDGFSDGDEITAGTNPNDATSFPSP